MLLYYLVKIIFCKFEIINNEKLLAANLMYEIHSQDDAADAGIKDIYMALQHYEEHLHTQKTESKGE